MNGKEICPVETVTVIVRAVLPWDSADGKDRIEICTHDRQSQIDYCLNHCPYAECVNCAGGGRTTSRGGRPPLLREAEMQKLRELLEARTDPADICREMHMDEDFLSRCKRKLRRERKQDDYLKMQKGVI